MNLSRSITLGLRSYQSDSVLYSNLPNRKYTHKHCNEITKMSFRCSFTLKRSNFLKRQIVVIHRENWQHTKSSRLRRACFIDVGAVLKLLIPDIYSTQCVSIIFQNFVDEN